MATKKYRKTTILDLAQQMISKDNVTCKCDPLNPGDPREGILRSRFLASFAAFRGECSSSEVDKVLFEIQQDGSRFDKFFPDWIPCSISSSICKIPHHEWGDCVTFVSNNTAIHDVFRRVINKWDDMYGSKSYLTHFEQDGISTQDMMESRNILLYISEQYRSFASLEDKFFEDKYEGNKRVIKDSACLNDEQTALAQELQELDDCYISSVPPS